MADLTPKEPADLEARQSAPPGMMVRTYAVALGELGKGLRGDERAAFLACLNRTRIGAEHPPDCMCNATEAERPLGRAAELEKGKTP